MISESGFLEFIGRRRRAALSRQENPSARSVEESVDDILRKAAASRDKGIRKDKWLFRFEGEVEEISDAIGKLAENGQSGEGMKLWRKLYEFAVDTMAESYMPMYLYILFRYADTLLDTGETEEALKLYRELCEGTERLIGIENSYGIHCLERLATAAHRSGNRAEESCALKKMRLIAEKEFGGGSAMALAVSRFTERMRAESAAKEIG